MRSVCAPVVFTVAACLLNGCSDATAPAGEAATSMRLSFVEAASVSQAERTALGTAFDRVDRYIVRIVDAVTLDALADTMIAVPSAVVEHDLAVQVPESALGRSAVVTLVAYDQATELYRSTSTVTLGNGLGGAPLVLEIRYTGPGIRGTVHDAQGAGLGGVNVELLQGLASIDVAVTEPDGTFLFVDVAPGAYQVQPVPPVGANACPAARSVTVGATSDAILADFRTQVSACGTSVLIVSGGDFDDTNDVATYLATDPNLAVSTFFYVNALPGSAVLDRYDVVLLFMNGLFDESAALGSQVRDYVEVGGNVVVTSFYWQGRGDSGLGSTGWGTLEAVDPFTSSGGARYEPAVLGTVVAHPLTTGVVSLSTATYWGGVAAKPGTTVVASWFDGTPLIGYRVLGGGQRVVGVSLFPVIGQAATGDVQLLFDNAVRWAGAAGGPAS